MKTIELTPLLESTTKRGLRSFWQGAVKQDDDGGVFLQFLSFQRKLDSEENQSVLRSTPKRVIGKNKGRSNETTDLEQATLELNSKMEDMIVRKGFHKEGEDELLIGPRPMLAHSFKAHGKKLKFPCYGQPKYDGFRMLQNHMNCWSRGNKMFIEKVISHLRLFDLLDELTTDGEIMLPLGGTDFNLSQSRIAKYYGPDSPPSSEELYYYIYDLIIPGTFKERWTRLNDWFFKMHESGDMPANIQLAPTYLIKNEEELNEHYALFLAQGFEGMILRNAAGTYDSGNRSYDLLKLKPYGDTEAEYEITGIKDGRGIDEEAVIFQCATPEGLLFKCRPAWPIPERKQKFMDFHSGKWNPVGKMLTIQYDSLSKDGIPRFPVAKNIRDYDLAGGNEGY